MYAHARNESRIFELYRDISHAFQATLGLSIADYFGYLWTRWEELANFKYIPYAPLDNAFATLDGDEQRHHLLPSLSLTESSPTIPDQMFSKPRWRAWGGQGGGRGWGTPRTGAIAEVEPMHDDSPDFNQLHTQIAQLQSHWGLAPSSLSFGLMAAIVAGTPIALHGLPSSPSPVVELFAKDGSIPPHPLPILESPLPRDPKFHSPPSFSGSLPSIVTTNPSQVYSRCMSAHDPLPTFSPESGISSPLISDIPHLRYPTHVPPLPLLSSLKQY
ncbi:hypothetical protein Acr_20g0007160 [Actinidia rufa]|uniref:Uncharacterized protein n=1 Tax=Actinidia rufa TaxID=165716 RepID=A0A7J0GDX7_9ERIC|nr:hypothetical protein Acr_20g0007160 [Actinidia rufa]